VRLLARRFGKDVLLARDEIPVPEGSSVAELRTFYAAWRSELIAQSEP
jgi:hypothetical protein